MKNIKLSWRVMKLLFLVACLNSSFLAAQITMAKIKLLHDTASLESTDSVYVSFINKGGNSFNDTIHLYYQTHFFKQPVLVGDSSLNDSAAYAATAVNLTLKAGDTSAAKAFAMPLTKKYFQPNFINVIVIWVGGYIADSADINLNVDGTLGINEYKSNENNFSIYPNPARSSVNIIRQNPNSLICTVKIYNDMGELVALNTGNVTDVDLGPLADGLYFIEIETTDRQFYCSRIIKR